MVCDNPPLHYAVGFGDELYGKAWVLALDTNWEVWRVRCHRVSRDARASMRDGVDKIEEFQIRRRDFIIFRRQSVWKTSIAQGQPHHPQQGSLESFFAAAEKATFNTTDLNSPVAQM